MIVALRLEQKREIVAEVAEVASRSLSLIALDYRGISVSEVTDLRAKAQKVGVHLRVVRNTLARRALKGTLFECMGDSLVGPMLLAFSPEEISAGARLVKDFTKTNKALEVKAISIGGKVLDKQQLDFLATLPTRDEALATLLAVMQAPISKLLQTMVAPHTKFVRTLAAVRDQKQSSA